MADPAFGSARVKAWKRHKWRSEEPLTRAQLTRMRDEFWDTEPAYGGDRNIWDALKAACDADLETARAILQGAGVIVAAADMSICYDERGSKYELPRFVISDPSNLVPTAPGKSGSSGGGSGLAGAGAGGQVELPAVAAGAGAGAAQIGGGSPDSEQLPEDAPLNQVAVR